MIVSLIVAISNNRAIGKDNQLIWQLPKDMKFFMDSTTSHPVIMGRKNYESIPEKYRPLRNRTNIIITRNKSFEANGCLVVNSIEESLRCMNFRDTEEIFVIGGGEIYKKFLDLNLIDRMYITHIDEFFEGDTFFPKIELSEWKEVKIDKRKKDENHNYDFTFIRYDKI